MKGYDFKFKSVWITWNTKPLFFLQGENEPTADQGGCHDKTVNQGRSAGGRNCPQGTTFNKSPTKRKENGQRVLMIFIYEVRKSWLKSLVKLKDANVFIRTASSSEWVTLKRTACRCLQLMSLNNMLNLSYNFLFHGKWCIINSTLKYPCIIIFSMVVWSHSKWIWPHFNPSKVNVLFLETSNQAKLWWSLPSFI